MRVAIMQPYIFPYIGYFQLMNAVDEFVIYDNIQFTKKGWINRNRILVNGADAYISFPLKKDSDYLDVKDRFLAETWPAERKKLLGRIEGSYRKAPQFKAAYTVIEQAVLAEEANLFAFAQHSISLVKDYLDIQTPLITASTIPIDHSLKAEQKVVALCKARNATEYINPIGGVELYDKARFKEEGLDLHFLKTDNIVYKQFDNEFVPFLSIIDVMMFNDKEVVKNMLSDFKLS